MTEYNSREQDSVRQFDKWAPEYDCGLWNSYFKSAYKNIVNISDTYINSDSKILDIGCGTGELEFLLSERINHGEIVGLDISKAMVDGAERKRLKSGLNSIKFISSKANSIAYPSNYFDVVFCLNSLHHFPDHSDFFKEASRVLKSGGKFVLLDLVKDNILRRAWIFIIKVVFGERDVEFHSTAEILKLLSDAGFVLKRKRYFMFFTLISVSEKN